MSSGKQFWIGVGANLFAALILGVLALCLHRSRRRDVEV